MRAFTAARRIVRLAIALGIVASLLVHHPNPAMLATLVWALATLTD